ncbi:MAG: ABC transporter permease [Chloroflexota bacterium]
MREVNAILTIAQRDALKFLRDRPRLVTSFIFPVLFIGVLGGSMQANLGKAVGYNFLWFIFTGVFAQTLFQSTTQGIVSLVIDRENDFSQEMFVSPISRYSIIFGKILGESLVALAQGIGILAFGWLVGIRYSPGQLVGLAIVGTLVCLLGGAFGVAVLANVNDQRAINQIFPFVVFPQLFLAGVFTPIQILPTYLEVVSRISPLRYAVDLTRGIFYAGQPDYSKVVLDPPLLNLAIMAGMFGLFLLAGTFLFVRKEHNR